MTTPVVPPVVPGLPAPPLPTDPPAVFDDKAAAFVSAQVGQVPSYNGAAAATYQNALSGIESANAAAGSAAQAAAISADVQSIANFKGRWVDLIGPMNKPATVEHEGRFWLLTRNVALVEAEEPGVSDAWVSTTGSVVVQETGASLTMEPGVRYVVTAPGVTLKVPSVLAVGDTFAAGGATYKPDPLNEATWVAVPYTIDWNGHTVKGQIPESPMTAPALSTFSVTYTGSTLA